MASARIRVGQLLKTVEAKFWEELSVTIRQIRSMEKTEETPPELYEKPLERNANESKAQMPPQKEFSIGMLKQKRSPGTIAATINMIIDSGLDHQTVCQQLLAVTKDCKTDEEFLSAVKAVLTEGRT